MIDPEWLQKEENHKYDTESRVVDSGPDWGEVDPKVQLAKQEKLKAQRKVMGTMNFINAYKPVKFT
jgi:hypothetical protein